MCRRDDGLVTLGAVPISYLVPDGWQWHLFPLSVEKGFLAYAALNKHAAPSFLTTCA